MTADPLFRHAWAAGCGCETDWRQAGTRRAALRHAWLRVDDGLACVLRATVDISAHTFSLAVRPRAGHLGRQASHAP
jgi:hypothetical protein